MLEALPVDVLDGFIGNHVFYASSGHLGTLKCLWIDSHLNHVVIKIGSVVQSRELHIYPPSSLFSINTILEFFHVSYSHINFFMSVEGGQSCGLGSPSSPISQN